VTQTQPTEPLILLAIVLYVLQNYYTNIVTTISCEKRKQSDHTNMIKAIPCERHKQNDYKYGHGDPMFM
jgi:hypothetical protein